VGLVAAVAIMMILSTVAMQHWADVVRRDNEAEMMFRAQDLVRAIQRYRRDHGGAGPQKLEQLIEPGPRGQYYLRQLWRDPLVRDGKWGLLYAGPGGQVIDPNAEAVGAGGLGPLDGANPFGTMAPFGGGAPGGGAPGGPGGSASGGPGGPGGPGGSGGPGGTGPGGGAAGSAPGGGIELKPASGTDLDAHAGGKQLAGLPIAGVKSLCQDEPFRVYNGLTEYAQWLFTYFDLEQQQLPGTPGLNLRPGMGGGGLGDGRSGFGGGRGGRPGGGAFGKGGRGKGPRPSPTPGDPGSGGPTGPPGSGLRPR